MEIALILLVSFLASMLTFFSGFGLGTILLPVFAFFFPVDIAIALTGVVHFVNNLFKIGLIGKKADRKVLLLFGLPAILASFAGAWLLLSISSLKMEISYSVLEKEFFLSPVNLMVAVLLFFFALWELVPSFSKIQFGKNRLAVGGILSGFLGGLTGIQGAIRSAFLIRSGLDKEAYIATGIVIACLVDITRLSVYSSRFRDAGMQDQWGLVFAASMAAISGAFLGNRLLKKVTMRTIQVLVGIMLMGVALGLGSGMIG